VVLLLVVLKVFNVVKHKVGTQTIMRGVEIIVSGGGGWLRWCSAGLKGYLRR